MRQHLAQELLDEDAGTPAEINRSLNDLAWIHQHLGGGSSWRQLIDAYVAAVSLPPSLRLLDVGGATGNVTRSIMAELGRRGCRPSAWVLDRSLLHLRPQAMPSLAADAFRLPFADHGLDLVTCNLFLHHFHDRPGLPQATQLLEEFIRVARQAVLINDLERAWLPYLAIRALAPRFSRITRYDGPRSVRQAYTPAELARLVGSRRHRILRLSHYRLGLILWCNRDL